MSFLAPLFFLGAAAVALPVVFHLMRQSPRVQKVFSSLMFLNPSAPRLTRRSRLEHLILLVLRCAVICLLALAFARPFWRQPMPGVPADGVVKKSVVLLDVSASMNRDGLWRAARERIEALVAESSAADQVAIFAFDQQLRVLVTFEEWNATATGDRVRLVRSRLASAEPGWGGTFLDQAVIHAAELLAESDDVNPGMEREVVVLTDLQEGSRTSDLQAYEWPDGVVIRTERLMPKKQGNANLQWLAEGGRDGDLSVRLRISNASDSSQEQFRVGWAREGGDGFSSEPREVYVPAGQSRVISLPTRSATGPEKAVLLTGDGEPFDNRAFVIPPVQAQLRVLYLGENKANEPSEPLYFLQRAFPDTARRAIQVVPVKSSEPLSPELADKAALIVATDTLHETIIQTVRASVADGGTMLFAPRSAASAQTLAKLVGIGDLPMTDSIPIDYSMLAEIDFRHPLFAPFADERFSDFTGIHFWKYRRVSESTIPEVRVLARFDNGDPAILEIPIGQGRLVVLASGWDPADSQLALSSKFVPLLFSLLELGGRAMLPPTQCMVGDSFPVDAADAPVASVEGPDGTARTFDAEAGSSLKATSPGLYTIASPRSPRQLAVNLHPLEGRTAPIPLDELERLGAPVSSAMPDPVRTAQRRVNLHNAEVEARQRLWRWAIAITLALLVLETGLAGRTARRAVVAGRASA